jgi:hypothetical protein
MIFPSHPAEKKKCKAYDNAQHILVINNYGITPLAFHISERVTMAMQIVTQTPYPLTFNKANQDL